MANYTIRISTFYDEFNGGTGYSVEGDSGIDFLQAGDRVYVEVNSLGGSTSGVTLAYASTAIFTSGGMIGHGQYRTVKSGVANGTTRTMYVYKNTSVQSSASISVRVQLADTYPDAFNIPNMYNIDPKALVKHTFRVLGINSSTNINMSATGSRDYFFTKNQSSLKLFNNTVKNGDFIHLYVEAEYDYNEMERTVTVTVGSRTESFKVVTRKWPLPEQVINIGISSPQDIRLKADVATFFGGESEPRLTDYLRGNFLVPSIEQNAHVPTSPPIMLTDLYDTASALYFIYKPPDKIANANTIGSSKNLRLTWNIANDYNVGYGKLAEYLEYRYVFTSSNEELQYSTGSPSDVTIHSASGSPGTWGQHNDWVYLNVDSLANRENIYKGTLTIYCRNAVDTSLVISKTVDWVMAFYGP